MSVRIKETICHGAYLQTRVRELPDLALHTIADFLDRSPYAVSHGPAIRRIWSELMDSGRASHGWSDYEILGGVA